MAQKQSQRSREQKGEARNKHINLCSINLQQRRQKYTMEKRQSLQQVVLGKLDSYMQKNHPGLFSHTIDTNKLKMD